MKIKKLISAVLASLMLAASFGFCVSAADIVAIEDYPATEYTTQQAKVDTMTMMYEDEDAGLQMYFDTQSGEFAIKNVKTGEYTFSNPYDVAVNTELTAEQKQAMLSQVILTYSNTELGTTSTFNSFTNAALFGNQITFKKLSDGVRVEYAIGTVESKRLIPIWIEANRFEEKILDVLEEHRSEMNESEKHVLNGIVESEAYYKYIGVNSIIRDDYEALKNNQTLEMYVFQQYGKARAMRDIENLIRKYCVEYTYDELEYDHEITMWEGDEAEPALFRLAIEYTIDDGRFKVEIPAKSIRYNETTYSLESIALLPYFGCTTTKTSGAVTRNGGYIFIPDGSGTLLEYRKDDGTVITNESQGSVIYGTDYTYDDISSINPNAEPYRLPVFGLTEYYTETITTERNNRPSLTTDVDFKRGWLAIITEGESFATVMANLGKVSGVTGGGSSEYSYACANFSTRQSDTVNTGSSLGTSNGLSTSVDTKYLGSYTVEYVLLGDPNLAAKAGLKNSYAPSYVGMADAYRDYLIKKGEMERLLADEIESTLPLYIQSFGYVEVDDTILTFPVKLKKALTTFEDVMTMSDTLIGHGITNLKFILTNYGNKVTKAKFPSVDGGNGGFKDLLAYAEEKGISVFPDYDFSNASELDIKSGFSLRKYAAQTMSGRYTTKRDYDPIYQTMNPMGRKNVISSASFKAVYEKFLKSFKKFDVKSISAMTLGTDLNSDFNEDNPLTREDSKQYTEEFLTTLRNSYSEVLVSGGNSYTLPYVTDIVDISLDNSRYYISTASVPFVGMVLHGYVNYAGTAINMAGDVQYQILKSIESGAAPYFILSYQNTDKMKDSEELSNFYSVNFGMWLDDVVKYYGELNDAIGSLQNATITSHEFENAFRMDERTAAAMFETYDKISGDLETARNEYIEAAAKVDQLIADGLSPDSAIKTETDKLAVYNAAKTAYANFKATFERRLVDSVVSVTYTTVSGKQKTFYINYNTFDVVVNTEDGVLTVPGESFVCSETAQPKKLDVQSIETATAYSPKTSEMKTYKSTVVSLAAAVSANNANQIERYHKALDNLEAKMTKSNDVLVVTDNSGNKIYINTMSTNTIVKIGDYNYVILAGQSYTIVKQ